ncbi:PREDICTED: carboxypeptidase D-like [Drosophila arizonae]|uniref:Carboxypeptidase D-like n=1 Tax=Drosophila arizonae TaxID=7263 RepID=A0ABM1PJE2_DROAR|nr:PREDICTED: carboxypeptidase D-like [Drosophila arizonae]
MYARAYVVVLAFTCLAAAASPVIEHAEVIDEGDSFLDNPHYLNNEQIGELFARLSRDYPGLAQTYSIGRSIQGRELHALALNAPAPDGNGDDLLRPMVKLVANIQGDEALGRQIVLYMAEYLASNYQLDSEVQRLLNTTEIHFLPSCNPDGFAAAKVSHNSIIINSNNE